MNPKIPEPAESNFPGGLGQPARRALAAAGYRRLEDLTGASEAEIKRLHGMGPKGIKILLHALETNGLSFAADKAWNRFERKAMQNHNSTQTAQKQDLIFTRVFAAPVEQVWQAWSDPEYVKQWWGPDGFTAPVAKIDFREGGTSLVCMSSPEYGQHYSTWYYREIVPLQRIEYIHNLADQDGHQVDPVQMGMPPDFPQDQRHTVTFQSLGERRTAMTVTEHDWTAGQMMELSRMGMEQCLDKMEAALKAGDK